jgi:hypothetical protein
MLHALNGDIGSVRLNQADKIKSHKRGILADYTPFVGIELSFGKAARKKEHKF